MNKVLKHYQLILIVVLIAALVLSIVTRPDSPVDVVNEYILNNKIDSLQKVIHTNTTKREEYNNNIIFLSDSIEGLNKQIKENDEKLSTLKNEFKETLDNIGTFTSNDITDYFSKRYD
jgi:peptidoglycan hydrolase CwlO-like protein